MSDTRRFAGGDVTLEAAVHGDGDRLALLLHGFPDTRSSMAGLADALATRGYTAVAPDLRGFESATGRPQSEYHTAHVLLDCLSLTDALGFEETAIVGHDLGAVVAYLGAAYAPDRLTHTVAMAVPPGFWSRLADHPLQVFRSWYMAFFQLPGVAEAAVRADDLALLDRLFREWSPGWSGPERDAHLEAVKRTFRTAGTVEAAMAYYREMMTPARRVEGFLEDPRIDPEAAREGLSGPAMVIAGREDGCIGAELFADIGESFIDPPTTRMADAGHFMHLERPEVVEGWVADFLAP